MPPLQGWQGWLTAYGRRTCNGSLPERSCPCPAKLRWLRLPCSAYGDGEIFTSYYSYEDHESSAAQRLRRVDCSGRAWPWSSSNVESYRAALTRSRPAVIRDGETGLDTARRPLFLGGGPAERDSHAPRPAVGQEKGSVLSGCGPGGVDNGHGQGVW